ncbi:MAG: carboxypeptidase regulatory-like domain-containing protein [Saprospiraceae bacterium]
MMKKGVLLLSFLLSVVLINAQNQATLQGKVTESATGEDAINAYVKLLKNGVAKTTVATDFEGNYSANVDPGTYDVEFSYVGMSTQITRGVVLNGGRITTLDVKLEANSQVLGAVVITDYKVPLVQQDNTTSGSTLTSQQISNMPTRNVTALVGLTAGVSTSKDGDINIKGTRSEGTIFIVDGVRVQAGGGLPPAQEIDQLQVITGGVEAQYGDLTGGAVSITTKGPASKMSGGIELETSKFLDSYDNNLVNANLSGPILRKTNADGTKGETILGFRLSANLLKHLDSSPSAVGSVKVKDEKLAELEANPLTRLGSTIVPSAEFLRESDVNRVKARPNEGLTRFDGTAKVDARLNKQMDVTLTGAYVRSQDQFTPGQNGVNSARKWILLNAQRNPFDNVERLRGNFRFRHRLGGNPSAEAGKSSSLIQNAQYSIQVGYENFKRGREDQIHKDNLFNYGYIGEFRDSVARVYGPDPDSLALGVPFAKHLGNRIDYVGFTAGKENKVLANYNNLFLDQGRLDLFPNRNGLFNSTFNTAWTNSNVGLIYNSFNKTNNDWITMNVNSSFDIVPGGSSKGRHSIQFGLLYEQRTERFFSLAPRDLWDMANLLSDQQFNGLADGSSITIDGVTSTKPTKVIGTFNVKDPRLPTGEQNVDIYAYHVVDNPDSKFYKEVRKIPGRETPLDVHFNVNTLRPDQLNLGMFSARELTDRLGVLNYYGFDYQGNQLDNSTTFNDFFTKRDANGIRTLPVAAFNPLYTAAFIQDKFQYKDIIFRLGLRIDRFDANTKVLKDDFSLYEIQSAKDFFANNPNVAKPGTIGEDYKVYVTDPTANSKTVQAYRDGIQWYDAKGTSLNDANLIFNGAVPKPLYTSEEPVKNIDYIKDAKFDPNNSFTDYKPQVNLMPRLAFSFPISQDANFYANYDVLVSRPTANFRATALDYFYFLDAGRISDDDPIDNSNLKPERTIYYEVGFQQKLNNSSALKLTAYYKELRDMIQRRTLFYVPIVNTYNSYGNIDFGTVKGFTFGYDLRRTGNVAMNINYTLQFADATGSDQNSQRGLTSRGNLRTIYPMSFDERHNIQASIDYRFDSGKKYNGPRIAGVNILENFGVNILANAISGTPYTARIVADKLGGAGTLGDINGARLPWKYNFDLRVDKIIRISNKENSNTSLSVFLRVQNILNTQNVLGVYSYSGDAKDDGYLKSSFGRQELDSYRAQGRDVQAFQDAYRWALLDPGNFSFPRRVFLGASFYF